MDWQFLAVIVLVALAALYAGWRFLRQFSHADDEAAACAKCPAAKPEFFGATNGDAPAPSSASPPGDGPRE